MYNAYRLYPSVAKNGMRPIYKAILGYGTGESSSHFLLFMVLMHISIRPSFASLLGKMLIADMALSAYSWASALVCSRPSLRETSSRACQAMLLESVSHTSGDKPTLRTSPSLPNFRPTKAPSSLFSFQANSNGAVASPNCRSAPAGLPSSSPLIV